MTHEVWIDDRRVGSFTVDKRAGYQFVSLTFTYLDEWLADERAFAISPDLPLRAGPHTPAPHLSSFSTFDDAAPDKWGRDLMDADVRRRAREKGEPYRALSDIERLLAVKDETRQGALRFRRDGQFLSTGGKLSGSRDLQKLARTAQRFADTGEIDSEVRELIGVGSSPGGAQPKAWVRDDDGTMHLAKFPRTSDLYDTSAWELTGINLQQRAGIRVQPSMTVPLGQEQSVFLTKRFDRAGSRRIPYMSFKSAFQISEYERLDYATLARKVTAISASPNLDAAELFTRAAFIALVNNVDDHMRNHGLLHAGNGWRLAPSFDVNPSRNGTSETPLTPEDDAHDRDITLLVEHAEDFRLTRNEAVRRILAVGDAVSHWRNDAVASGVAPAALDSMSPAFEGENRHRVSYLREESSTIIDMATGARSAGPTGEVWIKPHTRSGRAIEGHFRRRRN